MTIRPASAEYGIWFRRTDVIGRDPMVPARWDAVPSAKLCTLIANAEGGAAPAPRQQPAVRPQPKVSSSFDEDQEADPDQERIEIPAFLRRQAN